MTNTKLVSIQLAVEAKTKYGMKRIILKHKLKKRRQEEVLSRLLFTNEKTRQHFLSVGIDSCVISKKHLYICCQNGSEVRLKCDEVLPGYLRNEFILNNPDVANLYISSKVLPVSFVETNLEKFAPETWNKTCEAFLDAVDVFGEEVKNLNKNDLRYYIACFYLAKDLTGYVGYFIKTLLSKAIAKRKAS